MSEMKCCSTLSDRADVMTTVMTAPISAERLGLAATLSPAAKHLSSGPCSIVHFDLKPDNLLLDYTADGLTVKVICPCVIAMEVLAVC